jgi:3'-phosphoadenosine 5'-phosphosulfate sulfotransferase (PAPS reductase)/FAD synthetase
VTNPFRIDGPAVVSFSGGRTSGMMLHHILDAHGGRLPSDVHVVFANTGKEREETLRFVADCAERWDVHVRWLERDGSGDAGGRFREVEFESTSRNGEPFAELIAARKYLPNVVTRFCTEELKIRVLRDFMRAQGYDHWTNIVGLRRDEPHRVSRIRARQEHWYVACPLYDARVTEADVMAFWKAQPFDLALFSYEGNCDLCFLKGRTKRERIMRDHPEFVAWWADQERLIGGRFHAHEPGYAKTLDRVKRLPLLPMDLSGVDDTIPCTCTD